MEPSKIAMYVMQQELQKIAAPEALFELPAQALGGRLRLLKGLGKETQRSLGFRRFLPGTEAWQSSRAAKSKMKFDIEDVRAEYKRRMADYHHTMQTGTTEEAAEAARKLKELQAVRMRGPAISEKEYSQSLNNISPDARGLDAWTPRKKFMVGAAGAGALGAGVYGYSKYRQNQQQGGMMGY